MWSYFYSSFVGLSSHVVYQMNVGTLYEIHVGKEQLVVLSFKSDCISNSSYHANPLKVPILTAPIGVASQHESFVVP